MRRYVYALMAVLVLLVTVAPVGCSRQSLEEQLESVFSDTALIRDLDRVDIEWQIITPEELRARLAVIFEEGYSQAEAEIDAEVYVILDLIDEGEDLYEMLLDIYSEQVAGYYDEEEDKLYIVSEEGSLGPLEKATLVHEYTHALQDQRFDLKSLPLDSEDNSDAALAALALVEGDAVFVQAVYLWQVLSSDEREAFLKESEDIDSSMLDSAPPVIRENLLFPYEAGATFVMEVIEDGRLQALDLAYDDPPCTTAQILHPEKYIPGWTPDFVLMPDLGSALGPGWSQLDTDVLGELNIRIYLETFIHPMEAEDAAEGWCGDRYVYWKNLAGDKVFALMTVWDDRIDATEFFGAYIGFVQEKSGGARDLVLDGFNRKRWESDTMNVFLSKDSSDVLLVIASDDDALDRVLAEFPDFFLGE